MNEKLKLEAMILRSFLEYPDKIDEFLSTTPIKCFSEIGAQLLNIILDLKSKERLNAHALQVETPNALKNSPFFVEFLAALPSVLVLRLKDTLIKAYKNEMQKKLAKELEKASDNGELVDLELMQKELSVESKNYLTLAQWIEYYRQKPKVAQLKTGIEFLDSAFNGGIELGQFVLVSGDPEAGKTMLGLQILENVAKAHKVAFFLL